MLKRMFCTLSILAIPSLALAAPGLTAKQEMRARKFLAFAINVKLTNQLRQTHDIIAPYLNLVPTNKVSIASVAKDGFVVGTTGPIHYSLLRKNPRPDEPSFKPRCEGPFCFTARITGLNTNRPLVKNLTVEPDRVITLPAPGQPQ